MIQNIAQASALSFSTVVRLIIREWRENRRLSKVAAAHQAGLITHREALEQLDLLAGRAASDEDGRLREAIQKCLAGRITEDELFNLFKLRISE